MDRHSTRLCIAAVSIAVSAPLLSAQPAPKRTWEQIQESFRAHQGEFDYLLGDWEFTATNQEYGKIQGYWSAVHLDKGQILDEYRVVGDQGATTTSAPTTSPGPPTARRTEARRG